MRKIIRDTLAEWIIENDKSARVEKIEDPEEVMKLLKDKVVEEAMEVAASTRRAEVTVEIADLREVLLELMKKWNIDEGDVASAMISKRIERGAFKESYVLYDYDKREEHVKHN